MSDYVEIKERRLAKRTTKAQRRVAMVTLKCRALIDEPPWYIHRHRCNRDASMYEGIALCGVHIRVLKRWAATRLPEQLVRMVYFHWNIKWKTQTEKVKPSPANDGG